MCLVVPLTGNPVRFLVHTLVLPLFRYLIHQIGLVDAAVFRASRRGGRQLS